MFVKVATGGAFVSFPKTRGNSACWGLAKLRLDVKKTPLNS